MFMWEHVKPENNARCLVRIPVMCAFVSGKYSSTSQRSRYSSAGEAAVEEPQVQAWGEAAFSAG
jgi:hypothetical protein